MNRRATAAWAAALAGLLSGSASAGLRLGLESASAHRMAEGRVVLAASIENDGPSRSGVLRLEQVEVASHRLVEMPVELAAGARRRFLLAFDPAPGSNEFRVLLVEGERVAVEGTIEIPSLGWPELMVGVVGPVPGWLRRSAEDPGLAATELLPEALPEDARSWPSLDLVLWPAARIGDLDGPRRRALESWLRQGGRLLAGTAADQPRALEDLGFPRPPAEGRWSPLGLGSFAWTTGDLSRAEPPEALRPRVPASVASSPAWGAWAAPFELLSHSLMAVRGRAPDSPLTGVALALGAYLLAVGPVEWLLRRRSLRRGRRRRGGRWRRPIALVAATLSVLALCGAFGSRQLQAVRLDVIDLDLDGTAARGTSLLLLRRRRAGRSSLEAPSDTWLEPRRASGLRFGSEPMIEPGVHAIASTARGGLQSADRFSAAPWTTLGWKLSFEPDRRRLESLVQERLPGLLEDLRGGRGPAAALLVQPDELPEGEEPWTVQSRLAPCIGDAAAELERFVECAAFSISTVGELQRRRHRLADGVPAWPGGRALVLVETGSQGPELRLDGRRLEAPSLTAWRVRLPDGVEEPSP